MRVTVSQQKLLERLIAAKQESIAPKGGKHILIACMPKTASTFLCKAIAGIPGMTDVTLTFGYQRREQELCPLACSLAHDLNYVAQHHVRYSQPTQNLMTTFQIYPVILMRNVFDCVVSARDHLEKEGTEGPLGYLPPHILELPKEKQYDLIITMVVPWYVNFFACWSEYRGPGMRLFYRDMIQDFRGTISKILRAAELDTSNEIIDSAIELAKSQDIRFNVGKVGRGSEELSRKQIARIEEMFSHYSAVEGVNDILYRKVAS